MTFNEAINYLLSLGHETLAMKLGLTNIERLLSALDQPQNEYLKVQIAGTNGKGSTAAMLESICRFAGIETGLYTSPHLINITERIKINGEEISKEDFARLTLQVKETAERLVETGVLETLPTFFEHVTTIALLAFKEARVDVAILETGLGGRLDATTAARAEIVGITQIALDHQEYLGDTLDQIAFEKAAIIREGVKAVIAPQETEAMNVILKRCSEVGVEPIIEGCASEVEGVRDDGRVIATFTTNRQSAIGNRQSIYPHVHLNLRGRHQLVNASVAVCLTESLEDFSFRVSRAAVIEGLETVKNAGRLERWSTRPAILFDGAHNVAGARCLRDYLIEFVIEPITLVFGAMREKEIDEIAALLFPLAESVILTKPDSPRAASPDSLVRHKPENVDASKIQIASNVNEALRLAKEITSPEGLICVTGSLYLVGEAQKKMAEARP
jgi:dihydrofolate synthase/folylpolyglutamate synthase